jgi:ribosomal protein L24E
VLRWVRIVTAVAVLGGVAAMVPAGLAAAATLSHPVVGVAATPDGKGYWEVASDGGVFALGDAPFEGSTGGVALQAPVVGMAATPDGNGYREVASDGGIFAFGNAAFEGSMGGRPLNAPVVGMASTPDGRGYWEVASDGGIFAFGNATFEGSMGGRSLNAPVVGMASTPDGRGYWEVASDGGIFAFGDAVFEDSMGGRHLSAAVVGMAATPDGSGYWEVASDGGIFAFGDAVFEGSMGGRHLSAAVVSMAITPHGQGYWEVASDGDSTAFGDAMSLGSPPSVPPRVALYGDSLAGEAGEDFNSLAQSAGASAFVRTYPGTAPCDWIPEMSADDAAFHPTDVVLLFTGANFTPCMNGDALGSPQYYAKYQADMQAAIDLLRADGAHVFLVGVPYDESASLSANDATLNQLYASVAAANTGVDYVDAGQSVMSYGSFTWTLPCLPGEPCTGPSGTNVVRAPDGVHFCPNGVTTQVAYYTECTVYSSGAFRFATAMLNPALKG